MPDKKGKLFVSEGSWHFKIYNATFRVHKGAKYYYRMPVYHETIYNYIFRIVFCVPFIVYGWVRKTLYNWKSAVKRKAWDNMVWIEFVPKEKKK